MHAPLDAHTVACDVYVYMLAYECVHMRARVYVRVCTHLRVCI